VTLRHSNAAADSQREISRLFDEGILHELLHRAGYELLAMRQTVVNSYEDKTCHIDAWLTVENCERPLAVDFRGKRTAYWNDFNELTFSNPQLDQAESAFDWYIQYAIRKHPDGMFDRAVLVDGDTFRHLWRNRRKENWQPDSDPSDGKGQRILGWNLDRVKERGLTLAEWQKNPSRPART
jgi:hypothetical protein